MQWSDWLRLPLEYAAADGALDLFTRLADADVEDLLANLTDAGAGGGVGWGDLSYKLDNKDRTRDWVELGNLRDNHTNRRTRLDGFELEIFNLVQRHASSEQWRKWLRVPLEHAAADGHERLFARLTDAGTDGSAGYRGWWGQTLLAAAAHGRSERIVSAVLQAGGEDEVNVTSGKGNLSALQIAAARGAEEVSRVLMAAGADPNLRSVVDVDFSRTPLHPAAFQGHDRVVGTLLSKGALPDAKTDPGEETALHLAAMSGHELCVSKLLLAGADKDARDRHGMTPLHLAAQEDRLGVVEQLLAADAEVGALDEDCAPPIEYAAFYGNEDIVRALIRHGSSVEESEGGKGYTPLHRAAERNRDNGDVVRVLLEAGARIEAKTYVYGYTPLHVAASNNRIGDTIRALLKAGAEVNARDRNGGTPLHEACSESCVGGVELLLRWGADETLLNHSGDTPANKLGKWKSYPHSGYGKGSPYFGQDCYEGCDDEEVRHAVDQRICHMLARAPAYRPWGRRGWLVLARSRPDRVPLILNGSRSSNNDGGSPTKFAMVAGPCGGGDGVEDPRMLDLQRLVGRVVGLDVEDVFRLVVGFL